MQRPREHNLVLVGQQGVGKTTMAIQVTEQRYRDWYDPTGEESFRRQIVLDGETSMLDFLDTAGQEEYTALRELYTKTGDGFLVMYDITSRGSFEDAKRRWEEIKRIKDKNGMPTFVCILGNKIDLKVHRVVGVEEEKKMADELGCLFEECSAKTGENAEKGVFDLVMKIKKHRDAEKVLEEKRKEDDEKARIKAEKRKSSLWRRILNRR